MDLFYNWQYDLLYLHCSKTWSHGPWVLCNTIYLPCHFCSSLHLYCTLHFIINQAIFSLGIAMWKSELCSLKPDRNMCKSTSTTESAQKAGIWLHAHNSRPVETSFSHSAQSLYWHLHWARQLLCQGNFNTGQTRCREAVWNEFRLMGLKVSWSLRSRLSISLKCLSKMITCIFTEYHQAQKSSVLMWVVGTFIHTEVSNVLS